MRNILTVATKELLLLKRDRTGLLVLFIMPAMLVIVITLVQENIMELTGEKKTQMLFLDLDKGDLGISLRQQLTTKHMDIVVPDGQQQDITSIQNAINNGDYQVGIVIPEDSSIRIQKETARIFQKERENTTSASLVSMHVFFDPGIMPALRSGITAQLQVTLQTIDMEIKLKNLEKQLNNLLDNLNTSQSVAPPTIDLIKLIKQPFFVLEDNLGSNLKETPPYNPVQQNVPAWALFGIFFTAIPIAGAILQERKSGIWIRLNSLPVSHLLLFTGKILAYLGVCLSQFLLIAIIGSFLFPYIGLPAFTISHNPAAVFITAFFSSLAACGYGIFLGTACNTYEQASTVGATTVVTAAAIGGVMVPVYAMPQSMQSMSILSPLNWGLTAFHDLLIRGHSVSAILNDLGLLIIFFLLTILIAWKLIQTRL